MSRFIELREHLQRLTDNPDEPVNTELCDDVDMELLQNDTLSTTPLGSSIIRLLIHHLRPLDQPPNRTVSDLDCLFCLAKSLLLPLALPDIMAVVDPEAILSMLMSQNPSANLLGLAIVEKVAFLPHYLFSPEAAPLPWMLLVSIVGVWLSSPDMDVGITAGRVLGALLELDCNAPLVFFKNTAQGLNFVVSHSNFDDDSDTAAPSPAPVPAPPPAENIHYGYIWHLLLLGKNPIFAAVPVKCTFPLPDAPALPDSGVGTPPDAPEIATQSAAETQVQSEQVEVGQEEEEEEEEEEDTRATSSRDVEFLCNLLETPLDSDSEQDYSDYAAARLARYRRISVSQTRLLELLPRIAALNLAAVTNPMDFTNASVPSYADPTNTYRLSTLVQWVSLAMVDKSDPVMYLALVQFLEALFSCSRVAAITDTDRRQAVLVLADILGASIAEDESLKAMLLSLPNRTAPSQSEPLRNYMQMLIDKYWQKE